ncbi:MAG: amino acid ABC transporter substrate-binding protein [Anaerolineae bacterium]|nr:amino acid ABC transporter substrate-binding protein [Anaerolineae bacterium]
MAATTRRSVFLIGLAALAVWSLALAVGVWRWNSVLRVGPPGRSIFPYGELRVAIDPSNPPFAFPESESFAGIEPELAQAIGARLGVPVRLIPHGFDGLYDAIRADQADMAMAALVINPARSSDVRYSPAYFNAGLVLVVNGETPPASLSEAFSGRVALAYGSDEQTEAESWLRRVEPFEIAPYETREHALDVVRLGDADAALVDAITAGRYRAAYPGWESSLLQVSVVPYAAALRPDRPALAAAVERTLAGMLADGTLQTIISRYLR